MNAVETFMQAEPLLNSVLQERLQVLYVGGPEQVKYEDRFDKLCLDSLSGGMEQLIEMQRRGLSIPEMGRILKTKGEKGVQYAFDSAKRDISMQFPPNLRPEYSRRYLLRTIYLASLHGLISPLDPPLRVTDRFTGRDVLNLGYLTQGLRYKIIGTRRGLPASEYEVEREKLLRKFGESSTVEKVVSSLGEYKRQSLQTFQ